MPAPGIFVITGEDTLVINGVVFQGLADGSIIDMNFPNNIAAGKIGKNNNAIVAENKTGQLADFKLRVLMGSPEDKLLLTALNEQLNNFTETVLLTGQFTKNLGDGKGAVAHSNYVLSGGYFLKPIPQLSNVEGNTDQAVAMYELQFLMTTRSID